MSSKVTPERNSLAGRVRAAPGCQSLDTVTTKEDSVSLGSGQLWLWHWGLGILCHERGCCFAFLDKCMCVLETL